jgi:NADH-quinone oxidoreductase subunit H
MTVVGRTWERLTIPGKILAVVIPLGAVLTAGLALLIALLGGVVVQFLVDNLPLVRFVVAATIVLLMTVPSAFLIIYMEMKVIALMNLRYGPDRVGPFGSALSVVHGLKVLMKEDFTPTSADVPVFTLAPVVVYMSSVMSLLVLPFAPGIFGQDFNIGLLYFFAMGGLTVVGLLMAGWSSFNKIVLGQAGNVFDWYVFRQPLAFLIFFIAITAEANRTPFDLTEADSEIVAGFATEYSGMRFGFFFFAEYVNVFIASGLTVALFMGGWNAPFNWPWPVTVGLDPGGLGIGLLFLLGLGPPLAIVVLGLPFYLLNTQVKFWQALIIGFVLFNLLAVAAVLGLAFLSFDWVVGLLWFMGKTYVFVFTFVWMRGTLPRVRIDQLMGFAWKWLLPASLLNLFVTAGAILVVNR